MRFWIDIENSAGTRQGPGPLRTATRWRRTTRLDRAGEITAELPAADGRALLAVPKAVLRAYTLVGGVVTAQGAGIVDSHQVTEAAGIAPALTLGGPDLLAELARRTVGFLACDDGAGGPVTDALSRIMAFAPAGWSLDTGTGHAATMNPVYVQFAGESVLAALSKVAELTGEHFRLGTGRTVVWLQTDAPASGLRAVQGGRGTDLETNSAVCLITALEVADDSHELFTRIYPYGAGNAEARCDLSATSRSAPAGYTLDLGNNYIKANAAEVAYGRIDRHWTQKEVTPGADTPADATSAADQLFDAALVELARGSQVAATYRLSITHCDQILWPGTTIRVIARRTVDAVVVINVDADLRILEAVLEIDALGVRTVGLVVATVDRWPATDSEILVKTVKQARAMDAHLQPVVRAQSAASADSVSDPTLLHGLAPVDAGGSDFTADFTARVWEGTGGDASFFIGQAVTLPPAATAPVGWWYTFKIYGASPYYLRLTPDGSESIDGMGRLDLHSPYAAATLAPSADQSGRPGWSVLDQYLS